MHSVAILVRSLLLTLDFQFVNVNFRCCLIDRVKQAGRTIGKGLYYKIS
jgi:hypothetical protein